MTVVVRVRPDIAGALRGEGQAAGAAKVRSALRKAGARLVPMHPGATDPELASYFIAEASDAEKAQKLATELQRNNAVEAAYVKPADELP